LTWGTKTYHATSGGTYHNTDPKDGPVGIWDFRSEEHQDVQDYGPVPEGLYWISLKITGDAKLKGGQLVRGDGIQTIPGGSDDWGSNRVRLHPHKIESASAKKNRDEHSFYIHDSHKGYTHGCVEVLNSFFVDLRAYAVAESKKKGGKTKLWVQVDYASGASTQGNTKY
jgi:hypothetical protein